MKKKTGARGTWETAEAGSDFIELKEDGDSVQIIPLTIPCSFTKDKYKGKKGEKVTRYMFAVQDLTDKLVKLRECSGKENNRLRAVFEDSWMSKVLKITRQGGKGSTETRYTYEVAGDVSKVRTGVELTKLTLEASGIVKAALLF